MKQAGSAMAQIHSGMSIDKVDETMYVVDFLCFLRIFGTWFIDHVAGTNSENNTSSARKLARLLPKFRLASSRTRRSWSRSWKDWNRRLWTSVCSIRVLCRSIPSWTGYQRLGSRSVSSPLSHSHTRSPPPFLCTRLSSPANVIDQWRAKQPQSPQPRKTTKRQSWRSCAPKWPCSTQRRFPVAQPRPTSLPTRTLPHLPSWLAPSHHPCIGHSASKPSDPSSAFLFLVSVPRRQLVPASSLPIQLRCRSRHFSLWC